MVEMIFLQSHHSKSRVCDPPLPTTYLEEVYLARFDGIQDIDTEHPL